MNRPTEVAFSALRGLDPIAGQLVAMVHDESSEAEVKRQIAQILTLPRTGQTGPIETNAEGKWTAVHRHRSRPRFGTIGIVASAALAVIATLVWVSPSAGAPIRNADGAPPVSHGHASAPTPGAVTAVPGEGAPHAKGPAVALG
jgi:hypothetical protein